MKAFIDEYGPIIATVVVVVALIAIGYAISGDGQQALWNAYSKFTGRGNEALESMGEDFTPDPNWTPTTPDAGG